MTFTTSEFKTPRPRLLRTALTMCHSTPLWVTLTALVAAGAAMGLLLDWRYALVAAMLLLVLVPGVMAILYLNYALSPRCLPEAWPHTVTFTPEGFTVSATVPPLPASDDEGEAEAPRQIGFSASYSQVREVRAGVDGVVIRLKGTPPGLVHVPYAALPDSNENLAYILKKCGGR